ncbi:MAG: sigma 54-interacting transcriptional regulator [Pseudomonadota bacterium]
MGAKLDQRYFPIIFNTISHGIFTIDDAGRISSFNHEAGNITGYTEEEVLGKQCSEIFKADICEKFCPLKHSIVTRERMEDRDISIVTRDGRNIPIAISTAAMVNDTGQVIGGVEMFRDISDVRELRKRLYGSYIFEDIVTKSPAMKNVLEMIPLVANSRSTALIEGDSGTGKELVARAIHNLGPRSKRPFIAINCAALPDTLLESELFGYKRGAYTDAKTDKPGRFARAEKGTLFLDEVGDLSMPIQAKLLRVLEEKEYEPLGATGPVKADVRIIAATNKDLENEVGENRFRRDLYFRLNVVSIRLPPLTVRREDIPVLVDFFIKRFNTLQGRRISRCSERVMAALMTYPFPGNVRELENAIEHAFVVCSREIIQLEDLPTHIVSFVEKSAPAARVSGNPLKSAEAEAVRNALARHHGNRQRAADELGISRTTLWRKLKIDGF